MRHYTLVLMVLLGALSVIPSCQKEEPSFFTTPDNLWFDYTGGDGTITIQSNVPWSVSVSYPPDGERNWIHIDRKEGESGTTQLSIHADPSLGYTRTATLTFELTLNVDYRVVPLVQQGKLDREMSDLISPELYAYLLENIYLRTPGKVFYGDILNAKLLNVSGCSFDFMEDLAFFEELEELNCSNCGLKSISTPLSCLKSLICNDNELTGVDLTLFPALKELNCSNNPIRTLDLLSSTRLGLLYAFDTSLEELAVGPSLYSVLCSGSSMKKLDLSKATQLQHLTCENARVKELDLSATRIINLFCPHNPDLQAVILPEDSQLESLTCSDCQLSGELFIDSNRIREVNCDRNQLNRVVFSENTTPTTVYCFDNKLKDLVLPNVSRLRQLDCRNNLLSSVGPLSDAMNWNSFFTEGNPGAEGVFTVFIYDNVRYYSNIPSDWIWEGNEVSVRIVRVPAE